MLKLTVASSVTYTLPSGSEAGTPVVLSPSATLTDSIDSATIGITSGFATGDTLGTTVTAGSITSAYNAATGVLTLTGPDTAANFQAMLDHVQFNTTATSTTQRVISFTVFDGAANVVATEDVNIQGTTTGTPVSFYAASAVPLNGYSTDPQPVTLGQQFTVASAGSITAVRFYNGDTPGDKFVAGVYQSNGTLMGSGSMTSTAAGWQTIPMNPAIAVQSGQTYTAAYFDANAGGYAQDENVFLAPAYPKTSNGITFGTTSGVYTYGSALAFPTSEYKASDYWVDIVFQPSGPPAAAESFFASTVVPTQPDSNDTAADTVGMQFQVAAAGAIDAIKFYKGPTNTGTHVGGLWDSQGNLLTSVTFANETASGWQSQALAQPMELQPATTYVVGVFMPNGGYADDQNFVSATQNGITAEGTSGVFVYGSSLAYPTNHAPSPFQASNYYIDISFTPGQAGVAPPSPPPPPPPPPPGGNSLQNIPVAMFSALNDAATSAPTAANDYNEAGALQNWFKVLKKPTTPVMNGSIIYMPLAVGINPNYDGDSYGWWNAGGSDPQVADAGVRTWMISVGLNMPQGPTLDAAAATGQALYASGAPMDGHWWDAANGARFRANWAYPNPAINTIAQMCDTIYVRAGWEWTGGWYTWGMDAPNQVSDYNTAFAACWKRCIDVFRQVCSVPDKNGNTTKVIAVFNPNGDYAYPGTIDLDPVVNNILAAGGVIDLYAVDVYDEAQYEPGLDANGNPIDDPQTRFNTYILPNLNAIDAYAASKGAMCGICEWGAGQYGDNPAFMNGIATWAANAKSQVGVLGYWNGGPDSGYNSNMDSGWTGGANPFPNELAAYIANFGS